MLIRVDYLKLAVQGGEQRLQTFKKVVQIPSVSKTGLALDFTGFADTNVSAVLIQPCELWCALKNKRCEVSTIILSFTACESKSTAGICCGSIYLQCLAWGILNALELDKVPSLVTTVWRSSMAAEPHRKSMLAHAPV